MRRPEKSEHHEYYSRYVDLVPETDVLAVLRAQREDIDALERELGEARGGHRYAPDKWSVNEVLGHLSDGERVFAFRAFTFGRGDAASLPSFEQDDYVRAGRFDARTLASVAAEYRAVRAATLALFESFGEAEWDRKGIASERSFTVRTFPFVIAGHHRWHAKILRERYRG
jgi:hypothetical protein